ncbi:MAG: hypothetical protein ACI9EF_003354 [Pseudohongiellaceae bacterium]|jgi:hypothetical protein
MNQRARAESRARAVGEVFMVGIRLWVEGEGSNEREFPFQSTQAQ